MPWPRTTWLPLGPVHTSICHAVMSGPAAHVRWTDSPCINNDSPHAGFYLFQLRRNMNQSTNESIALALMRT